jgi:hypothetical protein
LVPDSTFFTFQQPIIMRKYIFLSLMALLSLSTPLVAQFNNNSGTFINDNDIILGGYRTGLLGIGFSDAATLRSAINSGSDLNPTFPRARFTVRDGILAH